MPAIPFAIDDGSIKIRVDLNGSAYVAVVDTGCAFDMLIPKTLAETLGLPIGAPVAIGGVTGVAPGYHTTVNVVIGEFSETVDAVVEPCRDILVGLPVLQRLGPQLVFDFERREIRPMPSSADVNDRISAIMRELGDLWRQADDEGKKEIHAIADANRRLFAATALGELVDLPQGYVGLRRSDGEIV